MTNSQTPTGNPNREDRAKFIIHMYDNYWDNISRAEEGAWKLIASVTGLFGIFLYIKPSLDTILTGVWSPIVLHFTLAAIVVFGIVSSLRNNLWFVRNLHLISNIEELMLLDEDYDALIPSAFKESGSSFVNLREIWWIHIIYYSILLLVVWVMSFFSGECLVTVGLVTMSLIAVGLQFSFTRSSWKNHQIDKRVLRNRRQVLQRS